MSSSFRPAQIEILRYQGGRMAVAAVPGSGKTFTLSHLAAQLIIQEKINARAGQQVLIVTYLNTSAENFKGKLRDLLQAQGVAPVGYDTRTLHSLSLEILRSTYTDETLPLVLDEGQSRYFLGRAIDYWREQNPAQWHSFINEDTPNGRLKWRNVVEQMAAKFIRIAKNERWSAENITTRLHELGEETAQFPLLPLLSGIYAQYQRLLQQRGALDFDDQVGLALDLLLSSAELTLHLRQRWPYILEDEAQDSTPLQEKLLTHLVGKEGNWVRVGDPNQAITNTFTSAHPRFLLQFMAQEDVVTHELPNSGRNAPKIYHLANQLVSWTRQAHPVPEVQEVAFRAQQIEPTPSGDAQPNPPDHEANVRMKGYDHSRDESADVVRLARAYVAKYPQRTAAILLPTNQLGQQIAQLLDEQKVEYDSLLRGGAQEREVATALHAVLALLADPLQGRLLRDLFYALRAIDHPAASDPLENEDRFQALLSSLYRTESVLYPRDDLDLINALPRGVAREAELLLLQKFTAFVRHLFTLRPLAIDALVLGLGDELFANRADGVREGDLAVAYQIAHVLRGWYDVDPERRLPDMVEELAEVVNGRRNLPSVRPMEGFEPRAGRITLATQHGAKGLEWDAVFVVSADGGWLPSSLEDYFMGVSELLGVDANASIEAELRYVMEGESGLYAGRSATDSAHIDVMAERLRLLYVSITRARRFLQISWAKVREHNGKDRPTQAALPVTALSHSM